MALASHPSAAYSAGGPRQAAVTGWGRAGPGEPLDTRPTLTRTVTSSEIARDFYVRHSEHRMEKRLTLELRGRQSHKVRVFQASKLSGVSLSSEKS